MKQQGQLDFGISLLACAACWLLCADLTQSAPPPDLVQPEKRPWVAKTIGSFKGHTVAVQTAILSPDGRLLVSTGNDKRDAELKLWNVATGKELAALPWPKAFIYSLAFSGDSQRLAVSGRGRESIITIWDIPKREIIATHQDRRYDSANTLAMNHNGSRFATAGYQSLGLWEVETGNPAFFSRSKELAGGGTFTPNLDRFAMGNSQDIDLWDVPAAKEPKIFGEHRGVVKRVAFSRDGKTLIAASVRSTGYFKWTGQVKFWDIATGKDRWTLAAETRQVVGMALSSDEKTLALLDYPEIDGKTELMLVDVPTGKRTFHHKAEDQRLLQPIFVNDDSVRLIGIAEDKTMHLWDVSR